jgi:hypothetical protein
MQSFGRYNDILNIDNEDEYGFAHIPEINNENDEEESDNNDEEDNGSRVRNITDNGIDN